jgi:hypothetical protein
MAAEDRREENLFKHAAIRKVFSLLPVYLLITFWAQLQQVSKRLSFKNKWITVLKKLATCLHPQPDTSNKIPFLLFL